jgi:hypothetical protein
VPCFGYFCGCLLANERRAELTYLSDKCHLVLSRAITKISAIAENLSSSIPRQPALTPMMVFPISIEHAFVDVAIERQHDAGARAHALPAGLLDQIAHLPRGAQSDDQSIAQVD